MIHSQKYSVLFQCRVLSSLESMSKKPVAASIIEISWNAAVNYRYQYCLVSVETIITVLSCAMLEQHLIKQCALKAFIKWMAGRQQQKQSTSKCAPSMGSTQLC